MTQVAKPSESVQAERTGVSVPVAQATTVVKPIATLPSVPVTQVAKPGESVQAERTGVSVPVAQATTALNLLQRFRQRL